MRTAFVSPFINDTNQYIQNHKQLLAECGYDVKPLSFRTLFSGQIRHLFSRKNILVFHWIETRPFYWEKSTPKFSLSGWLQWLIYSFVASLCLARVVYFMHDHAVHDATGFKRKVSIAIIRLFAKIASIRVVHDPSFCKTYNAIYLPHPLYWDNGKTASRTEQTDYRADTPLRCGILGAIRPYKNIDTVLENWPNEYHLTIKGRGADDYVAKLQSIITSRKLGNSVLLQSGFLTDAEFDAALGEIDVLILPHRTDSMLVSGSFFEGIGRIPVIVARTSPFIQWAATKSESVIPFADDRDLPVALERARNYLARHSRSAGRSFAIQEFGWAHCKDTYAKALA